MNFYASHQRPLQRRSYTGRPSRPAEGQLRVKLRPSGHVSATAASPPIAEVAVPAFIGAKRQT